MIQLTPHMRILVAVEPADFRKGIDGLAGLCTQQLRQDPFKGALFVFRNRRATALKILTYDGQGFWICHKRLSKGRFGWWPQRGSSSPTRALEAHQLSVLLSGGNPAAARGLRPWRRIDLTP
jgi:transposase